MKTKKAADRFHFGIIVSNINPKATSEKTLAVVFQTIWLNLPYLRIMSKNVEIYIN